MPRAIWNGAISFGLVNIPVKLVTATQSKKVSFREVRRGDNSRIRHRKVAANDGEEVTQDQIVKGYEIAPDRYVVLDPDELKALDPGRSRAIDIEDFVDLADIEPLQYESSYYLLPGEMGGKSYELLRRAMQETGKAGVARFTLRSKQYLAVLRPVGPALAVSTLLYHDEVVSPAQLDGLPEDVEVADRELTMASSLIESMTVAWDPTRYEDEHRQRVLELIERKAEGEDLAEASTPERDAGDVVDLMAALEASLSAAKAGDEPRDAGRRDTA
ncbi:non-homologous end joining protein Ku [Egicoccus halophilus]|uniref:Non-homologous end joining protein Ku n=1 Tax=Egicoccus halophilus TaxID=1670830 RepID=A0A8J3ETE8_9ACTN|nr:Ku protein [Egicoccus halophilus]GGI05474.1 non-homologous end joining protein Ku [Egicoccus halophilus]